jgi:short-subunit dehydrogenase
VTFFVTTCRGITVTIICPGPVTTGVPGGIRVLYGAKGLIQRVEVDDSRRMRQARAVELVANAMAAGLDEVWLAKHPVLLMSEW